MKNRASDSELLNKGKRVYGKYREKRDEVFKRAERPRDDDRDEAFRDPGTFTITVQGRIPDDRPQPEGKKRGAELRDREAEVG